MTFAEVIELKKNEIIDIKEARKLINIDNLLETSDAPVCPDCKKSMTKERIKEGPSLHLSHRFVWICGCTVDYK